MNYLGIAHLCTGNSMKRASNVAAKNGAEERMTEKK